MMSVDIQNQEISKTNTNTIKKEYRKIMVPANRMKPLKENWTTIVKALVEHMKLQVRMNTKRRAVEIRVSFN